MLATKDGRFSRVAVFCDRRDKKDDGGGPSAQGVKEEIEMLAKGDRKAGRAETKIHLVELLVGARRVHEREASAKRLRALGFIGERASISARRSASRRRIGRPTVSPRGGSTFARVALRGIVTSPAGLPSVTTLVRSAFRGNLIRE
jgi:hypothetical protein